MTNISLVSYLLAGSILFLMFYLFYPHFSYDKVLWILPVFAVVLFLYDTYNSEKEHWIQKHVRSPLVAAYLKKIPLFSLLLFALALVINVSILYETWLKNIGHPLFTIGGFLPYSDPQGYCAGAKRLIEFGRLDEWNSLRRPLPICFYAVLLKVTGQNLQLTIFITVVLVAISIYHAAKTIYFAFGTFAAFLMLLLLSSFFSFFNGTLLTEPVGLLFGNYAFVFLFTGVYTSKKGRYIFGLFLLALALSIRVGAFFILPLLVLYGAYHFRNKARLNYRHGLMGIIVILMVMIINSTMLTLVGSSGKGLRISNFSYTLYGMVKGGKGWTHVYNEHPELSSLPEAEQSRLAYEYAKAELKKNPIPFFATIGRVLLHSTLHLFSFTIPFNFVINKYSLLVPFIMVFIGLFVIKENKIRQLGLFLIVSLIGIVLSSPFLVDGGYRVYAATMPINCALVSVGTGILLELIKFKKDNKGFLLEHHDNHDGFHFHAALALLLILIVGPLFVKVISDRKLQNKIAAHCEDRVVFRAKNVAYIHIVGDNTTPSTLSEVKISAYNKNNPSVFLNNHVFKAVKKGDYLAGIFDLCTQKWFHIVFDNDIGIYSDGFLSAELVRLGGNGVHDLYQGKIVTHFE
ncbi:MAG: hypothetical protein GF401_12845 [Chitinivibrionales bacterium]|nr:hypothetical protein [Chitinivibrionales bacterium]